MLIPKVISGFMKLLGLRREFSFPPLLDRRGSYEMGEGLGSKGQCGKIRAVDHADEPGALCVYEEKEAYSASEEVCAQSGSTGQCAMMEIKTNPSIECSPCHSNVSLPGAITGVWGFHLILQRPSMISLDGINLH